MEIQHLKVLAGRVRDLLAQQNHQIVHGQALDLVAALPGLRNWPEVVAFPARLDDCLLTESTASRLAHRLKTRFGWSIDPASLLRVLDPAAGTARQLPELWPSGAEPGVYVTTSQDAINALMAKYEDATDGAALYAEQAGQNSDACIDLGDQGLWSQGLGRVPSGTLVVVGPLEMAQDEWERNAERMEMACLHAYNSGHRVAVLFETLAPGQLHQDAVLLVKAKDPDGDLHEMLKGIVTAEGDLVVETPFFKPPPAPVRVPNPQPLHQLPEKVSRRLVDALAARPFGILVVGSSLRKENRGELLETVLPLTDAAGPVARIMPSLRPGYGNEPNLSDRFQGIPVLPSVASAYASGYRRMVIEQPYSASEAMLSHAGDVCFLLGTWATEVGDAFIQATRPRDFDNPEMLDHLIAVVGLEEIPTKTGVHVLSDLYVHAIAEGPDRVGDVMDHLNNNRVLRFEDDLQALLSQHLVTPGQVKKALPRHRAALAFLAEQAKRQKAKKA